MGQFRWFNGTPYKYSTTRFDPTGDTGIGAYSGIIGGTGSITAGQGGSTVAERTSFDRRVSNVLQYWTPAWNGLSGRLAYGVTDTNLGSAATGVAENLGLKPRLYSAMGAYEMGPLYATLAFEQHDDFQPLKLLAAPASSGRTCVREESLRFLDSSARGIMSALIPGR